MKEKNYSIPTAILGAALGAYMTLVGCAAKNPAANNQTSNIKPSIATETQSLDAYLTATPSTGNAPLMVRFDFGNNSIASRVLDIDGQKYQIASDVASLTHLFADKGNYTANFNVYGANGETDSATQRVLVKKAR